MEIQKTAKTMIITGTPDEMRRLAELNPKLAQQINDARLPEFMGKVDQMYREFFNMPGGLPEGLREQIATGIRDGLRNTQSGSSLEGTEPAVQLPDNEVLNNESIQSEQVMPDKFKANYEDGADQFEQQPEGGILNPEALPNDVAEETKDNIKDWQDKSPSEFVPSNDDILDSGEIPTTPSGDKQNRMDNHRRRTNEEMGIEDELGALASMDRNRRLTKSSQQDEILSRIAKHLKK